jgi:predicted choloylglycine hydrolase
LKIDLFFVGKVYKMSKTELELLKLGGSPYDIGYQHGKQGKERIKDFLNIIVDHGEKLIPDLTSVKAFAQARKYIPFVEAYAPHLGKEIKGIAEGAKISVEEAYLLQVRAEFTQLTIEEKPGSEGCTSFAIHKSRTEDGEVWIGQNLDLAPFYKDFGVMLHITPEKGPVILCYSQIGSVAHVGINSAGIGWAANALYSSGWKPGVPRPILYRLIMEKENLPEAISVVTDAKRASSCNYLISHKSGEVKDLETTPDHYGIIDPWRGILVHTNHFAHPEMIQFEKRPRDKLENSKFRENRFKQLVTEHCGKLTIEKLKEFLADHQLYPTAVCTHAEGNPWNIATIAALIAQPSRGIMHVALGQACKKQYATYAI